jgi:metal-responsive CopG/Arc/MetJ family transcriptional regulator
LGRYLSRSAWLRAGRMPAERVRINITIDKGLLRVADEAAEAEGMNRSAFIERALEAATSG